MSGNFNIIYYGVIGKFGEHYIWLIRQARNSGDNLSAVYLYFMSYNTCAVHYKH